MNELKNKALQRKELLKHMILQLHEGEAPEAVRSQLVRLLGQVPYNDVVAVEQELIAEGLPQEEVLKLCDIHTEALDGAIDHSGAKTAPPGHPVHTFKEENRALQREIAELEKLYIQAVETEDNKQLHKILSNIRIHFNALTDVEKHYQRKENLLFPFLEKHDVTGPPAVMWGKHDETREFLKGALETLAAAAEISTSEAAAVIDLVLKPASKAVDDMIYKEEEILFPMCLDTLTEKEWYDVNRQSPEIGFCLYDPADTWKPEGLENQEDELPESGKVLFPSGSMSAAELTAVLNTIPFDMTFVDKDDTVRYFTQGKERIFARNRAILGRKIQMCHPPSSVHIVETILQDFKSGAQDQTAFWIELEGRFIHIEYYALRGKQGEYLGTLEVSQDLTEKRSLEGEQRLLNYKTKEG